MRAAELKGCRLCLLDTVNTQWLPKQKGQIVVLQICEKEIQMDMGKTTVHLVGG